MSRSRVAIIALVAWAAAQVEHVHAMKWPSRTKRNDVRITKTDAIQNIHRWRRVKLSPSWDEVNGPNGNKILEVYNNYYDARQQHRILSEVYQAKEKLVDESVQARDPNVVESISLPAEFRFKDIKPIVTDPQQAGNDRFVRLGRDSELPIFRDPNGLPIPNQYLHLVLQTDQPIGYLSGRDMYSYEREKSLSERAKSRFGGYGEASKQQDLVDYLLNSQGKMMTPSQQELEILKYKWSDPGSNRIDRQGLESDIQQFYARSVQYLQNGWAETLGTLAAAQQEATKKRFQVKKGFGELVKKQGGPTGFMLGDIGLMAATAGGDRPIDPTSPAPPIQNANSDQGLYLLFFPQNGQKKHEQSYNILPRHLNLYQLKQPW